jgi:hypothetical protein
MLSLPRRSACADSGAGTPRSFRRGFNLPPIASVQVGHGSHRSGEPTGLADHLAIVEEGTLTFEERRLHDVERRPDLAKRVEWVAETRVVTAAYILPGDLHQTCRSNRGSTPPVRGQQLVDAFLRDGLRCGDLTVTTTSSLAAASGSTVTAATRKPTFESGSSVAPPRLD